MEHRPRRKQLNSDTNASNKKYLKEIQEKRISEKNEQMNKNEKNEKKQENMFLSFFLDGWSDHAVRWVNARFLTLLTVSGRSDQSHRLAPMV